MNAHLEQLFSLTGKSAIITGGTGVLGQSMVRGIAAAGASVAILGRRRQQAEELAKSVITSGGNAIAIVADVLDKDQLVKARETVMSEFGAIDILVNAAGGNTPGAVVNPDKSFSDLDIKEFQKVVDLNLLGTVLPSQVFSTDMIARKKGVIVNIASMAAIRAITRVVGYSAAKGAVDNFTRWMAVELAKKYGEGLRVNSISPGFFLTEQNRALLTNPDGTPTQRAQDIKRQTPFGRFGKADELVGTLIWLCSDASAFVTGINVPVDGGFSVYSGV